MKRLILTFFATSLLTFQIASADNTTTYALVDGHLKISIPTEWKKIGENKSQRAEVITFQIPNKADENTPHSSNVAITVQKLREDADLNIFGYAVKTSMSRRPDVIITSDTGSQTDRRILLGRGQQHNLPYILTSTVGVHEGYGIDLFLAYPLLEKATKEWNESLLRNFNDIPESVTLNGKAFFKKK